MKDTEDRRGARKDMEGYGWQETEDELSTAESEDSSSMGGPPSAEEQRWHSESAASEGSSSQDKVSIAELPN